MRRFAFLSALGLAAVYGLPAAAQSAYTTDQLVDFYIKSVDLGATRGICIGTAQECAPATEKPKGLDMLVTFELDSAELTADTKQNLAVFAQMMQDERLQAAHFVVEGYTDARGTDGYNMKLSEDRASAVRAYLTALGVSEDRLAAVGLGKAIRGCPTPMTRKTAGSSCASTCTEPAPFGERPASSTRAFSVSQDRGRVIGAV